MKVTILQILLLALLLTFPPAEGQEAPDTTLDLSSLATGEAWAIFNRSPTIAEDGPRTRVSIWTRKKDSLDC